MTDHFITYQSGRVHYLLFGEGNIPLFCFPGFGDTAESFLVLQPSLGKRYKVIAIDLPLHGKTEWPAGKLFTRADLKNLIDALLKEVGGNKFSLMGFSMGGKMALSAVTQFPGQVKEVFLLAPDGLKRNVWYDMSIYPAWGRKLFRYVVEHPEKFFGTVNFLTSLRLLPSSMKKFLTKQMETKEKRQLVFDVWDTIKDFRVDKAGVKQALNENGIKLFLFFGEFDKVIKPRLGYQFVNGLKHYTIKVLPKGHTLVKDYMNPYLTEALKEL